MNIYNIQSNVYIINKMQQSINVRTDIKFQKTSKSVILIELIKKLSIFFVGKTFSHPSLTKLAIKLKI